MCASNSEGQIPHHMAGFVFQKKIQVCAVVSKICTAPTDGTSGVTNGGWSATDGSWKVTDGSWECN